MPEQLSPDEFADRFTDLFGRSAFRLETLGYYQSDEELEPYLKWLAGEHDDLAWKQPWLQLVASAVRSGKTMARVHAVGESLTNYLRFEIGRVYPPAVDAGEDVRIQLTNEPSALGPDFWLLDDHVAVMHYSADGAWVGVELYDDAATAARYRALRDRLMSDSTPLRQYIDQHRRKSA